MLLSPLKHSQNNRIEIISLSCTWIVKALYGGGIPCKVIEYWSSFRNDFTRLSRYEQSGQQDNPNYCLNVNYHAVHGRHTWGFLDRYSSCKKRDGILKF